LKVENLPQRRRWTQKADAPESLRDARIIDRGLKIPERPSVQGTSPGGKSPSIGTQVDNLIAAGLAARLGSHST
jgi:hypothetical protein